MRTIQYIIGQLNKNCHTHKRNRFTYILRLKLVEAFHLSTPDDSRLSR